MIFWILETEKPDEKDSAVENFGNAVEGRKISGRFGKAETVTFTVRVGHNSRQGAGGGRRRPAKCVPHVVYFLNFPGVFALPGNPGNKMENR